MKKRALLPSLLLLSTLVLTACSDSGSSEGGGTDSQDDQSGDTSGDGGGGGTDTSGTDTSGTDTSGTDTSGTDTSGTDTSGTDTSGTDTSGTDTSGTDTSGTDTSGTDTSGTDTSGTDTSGTDTSGTDTSGTDTSGADTSGTDTSGTDTSGTDTSGTDTSGTDTSGTDTSGTDTSGTDTSGTDTGGTDTGGTDTGGADSGGNSNNTAPAIDEFSASPDDLMIDEAVTFDWVIQDADADSLTCHLDVDGDGTSDYSLASCSSNMVVDHIYSVPGEYAPTLEVRDGNGGVAVADTELTVVPLSIKMIAEPFVKAGQWMRYQLTISNVSLVPVKNTRVLYRVPAGQSFHYSDDLSPNSTYSGCSVCTDGEEVYWDFPSLAAGQSKVIDINAFIEDTVEADSSITVPLTVTADELFDSIKLEKSVTVVNDSRSMLEMSSRSDAVQAGERMSMVVDIGNISNANLSDLQLRSYLPRDVWDVEVLSGGNYEQNSHSVVWDISALPVLQSAQRSVSYRVSEDAVPGQILVSRSELSLAGDPIDSRSEYAVTVSGDAPSVNLEVDMVSAPVAADSSMRYELTVSNTSLIPVKNVRINYRVPDGLSVHYTQDTVPDAVYSGCSICKQQDEMYWQFDSMAAGQSHTIDISAYLVDTVQAGTLISAPFTLKADGLLDDIMVMKTFSVSNASVVDMAMSSSSDSLQPGEDFSLQVDIGNDSASEVSNLDVATRLPAGALFQSASDGGTLNADGDTVSWQVGALPVADAVRRTVNLTVPTDAIAGQIFTSSTQVVHDGGLEIDRVADHSLTITDIQQPLSLQVEVASGEVEPGKRMRFEITLQNESLVPIKDVKVTLRTPEGISFHYTDDAEPDARYTGCSQCTAGDEAYWEFPSMDIGKTEVIELNANVLTSAPRGSLIVTPFRATSAEQTDDIRLISVEPVK